MVKETQKKGTVIASKNKLRYPAIRTKQNDRVKERNCALTETQTTTQKPNFAPNDENSIRVRKCVIKIKRVTLKNNNNPINETPSNAQTPGAVQSTSANIICDKREFRPARNSTMYLPEPATVAKITPFKVRIRRLTAVQPARETNTAAEVTPCKVRIRRLNAVQSAKEQNADAEVPISAKNNTQKKRKEPEGQHRFFHRDQPPTRTRSSVTRNVYEFLSESQIDDNALDQRKDAAADIIKEMIEDGRACAVMRTKTGTNRARPVKKKVRPVGRRKQCSIKSINEKKHAEPPLNIERPLSPIYEPEPDSSDEDNQNNEAVNVEVPAQVHVQPPPPSNVTANQNRTLQEGAYSPLARSLLLNKVRKLYSTPMNRINMTTKSDAIAFSPILPQSTNRQAAPTAAISSPSGESSPWRVPDEAPLPNTFVFGFNTSQLPSYSSDHMRRPHVYVPDEPEPSAESTLNTENSFPAVNMLRIDSAANDSNGENVPPAIESVSAAANPPIELSGQENENEENIVQLPNPRRTLQQRTPLKDINILDVVVLPSWKNNMQLPKTPVKENRTRNHVHFEDSIDNTLSKPVENTFSKSPRQQLGQPAVRQPQSPCNLFGFEEDLEESEHSQENNIQLPSNHNITLNEKLQRLKVLRPTDKELPQISKAPLRHAYDDLTARTPIQRNIKDMLCSTMIATSRPALAANESTDLFKDMDPEVTFNEKQPRRTYVRERPKRKRKQRVHALFIDTDSSESEDNEQESNDKSADSPKKMVPDKKRARRDVEHEAKLRQFITSFNQECAEVEKFPLIVE